ncbi:MAG: FixH family protein, partial [Candidatus Aenigmarchaeota archaeon]|nr:FixH family protein [Candidatus Aenigmarchaeota archaeon]
MAVAVLSAEMKVMNAKNARRMTAIILFLSLIPAVSWAHEAEGTVEEAGGFTVEAFPSTASQGAANIEARIEKNETPVTGLNVTLTVDNHDKGISDALAAIETEPGHYSAAYKFTTYGAYEVHVEFSADGTEIR